MLVTAESHNDILGKQSIGEEKNIFLRSNYKASFRIGNGTKKLGVGVRPDTVYRIQNIVNSEVLILSSFHCHKKTECPLNILFNFRTDYYLQGI